MSLPGISNGQDFPGYDDDEEEEHEAEGEEDPADADEGEEDQQRQQHQRRVQEGPPVRRRRLLGSSGPRLPGLAELDRNIAADRVAMSEGAMFIKQEGGRRIKLERDGRRGSGSTGGSSGGSRRSR